MTVTGSVWWQAARGGVAVLAGLALLAGWVAGAGTAGAQQPPPNTPCPPDTPQAEFVDRHQARSGHAPSIDCVAFHAIALGSTNPTGDPVYLPAGIVNRAQMATFIANTLDAVGADLPDGDAPDEFTDIADTVHRPRINALARAGIVAGFPDDSYRPTQPVTRAQMATFMVQAAEWALEIELEADAGPYFSDTEGNTHEANIDAGFEAGLYEGRVAPEPGTPRSGTYAPRDGTRRDQMATFLSRLLDHLWDFQGIAGLVTDASTGHPIPGVVVTIQAEPVDPQADPVIVNSGETGLYRADLEVGTYTVTAVADDYAEPEPRTGVTVTGNEVTIVNFALESFPPPTDPDLGVVVGRVTQSITQIPVPDATVTVFDDDTEVGHTTVDALGNYSVPVAVGNYNVTADAPGHLPSTEEDVAVTAGAFVAVDFALQLEPSSAVLTPDRELAPVSEVADPSTPSRGDVAFVLTAFDEDGNPVEPEGRAYTFAIANNGDSPVEACIYCGDGDDSTEILTIAAGGVGVFEDVPDRHLIRIDAADPSSVTVTASTSVDGQTRGAASGTTWVDVDFAPTGEGASASLEGEIVAYDHGSRWYFFTTAEGTNVFIEYAGGEVDLYLVGHVGIDLNLFEEALQTGMTISYFTDGTNEQMHWLSPPR